MKKELIQKGKFLSLILRHKPEEIDLTLDQYGWAELKKIISNKKMSLTFEEIKEIVETNDKKRFEFDAEKKKIRARQGHSIDVDVELEEFIPTDFLYHGTATRFLTSIFETGLSKRNRNHVHLSDNIEVAMSVGSRHGTPIALKVDAVKLFEKNHKFYKSNNGVYLTDNVPVEYISII